MYQYLINHNTPFSNKFIWKLKIPLRIKIFLWYLQRGVILTKDNLAKMNWTDSQKFGFCDSQETIKHLFFDCQYAKTIWNIVHIATGLTPPRLTSHMFPRWLTSLGNLEYTYWSCFSEKKTIYFFYTGHIQENILATILDVVAAWGYKGDYPFSEQSIGGCRSGHIRQERMEKQ